MKPKSVQHFRSQALLRKWFDKNHGKSTELWIRFYKKTSRKTGASYPEALDEALCFGWIDGIKQTVDEESYTIRFTPRRAKSVWSKVNTGHVERLVKADLMRPAGLKEVELAKRDGRWKKAYSSSKNLTMPRYFLAALAKNKKAKTFYETLNKANRFAISYRLQNSKKPETRERWIQRIIQMLAKGEKFY
ncbi:MAG: YdeI family protein [Bdellovibrionales bacterium]